MSEVQSSTAISPQAQAFLSWEPTDSSTTEDLNKQLEQGVSKSMSENKKHTEETHQASEVTTLDMGATPDDSAADQAMSPIQLMSG
ncbi:MAG: hypothetical protein FJZ57_01000 [Chlamydiae bacterium]|nr:hypothetical protein [Chlamydiota bacterium]